MSQKRKTNNNNFYLAIAVLLIVLVIFTVAKKQQQSHVIQPVQTQNNLPTAKPVKIYHSKKLNITINVPEYYDVEEKFVSIALKKNGTNEKITILRSGTNHDSLENYLNYLETVNKLNVLSKEKIIINGLDAMKLNINGDWSYLIYKDNWIFSIETNSDALSSDLDRMAQSFRYE